VSFHHSFFNFTDKSHFVSLAITFHICILCVQLVPYFFKTQFWVYLWNLQTLPSFKLHFQTVYKNCRCYGYFAYFKTLSNLNLFGPKPRCGAVVVKHWGGMIPDRWNYRKSYVSGNRYAHPPHSQPLCPLCPISCSLFIVPLSIAHRWLVAPVIHPPRSGSQG
jgi:hypothetical protein